MNNRTILKEENKLQTAPFEQPAVSVTINVPTLVESRSDLSVTDWTNPLSFGGGPMFFDDVILPEIDCTFLPAWISDFIAAISYKYQVPVGTATMLTLAILAACIQKQFVVSPYKDNRYVAPLNIWTLVLTDSRAKRFILDALVKPIINKETQLMEELKDSTDVDVLQDFHKATIRCLINKAARAEVDALLEYKNSEARSKHKMAKDLVMQASDVKHEMPPPIKSSNMIITNDITKKNLQLKLAEHLGKLAIISDDSNLLKCMSSPDFLHGYSGGNLRVKMTDSYVMELDHIAITAGLIVPPEALYGLKAKSCPYSKELASDFLYYMADLTFAKDNLHGRQVTLEGARLGYEAGIEFMLSLQLPLNFDKNTNQNLPTIMRLSNEALELWHQFYDELDSKIGQGGQLEALCSWVKNLPGTALSIAGLVHITTLVGQYLELIVSSSQETQSELMSSTSSPLSPFFDSNLERNLVIEKQTMEKVIALCKKLIAHAEVAYDVLKIDKASADAKYILDWIYKHSEVDKNGAIYIRQRKLCRSSHLPIKRIIEALNWLHRQNILSPLASLETRKPTYVWYVNPEIFKCKVKEKFNLIGQGSKLLAYAS
jgi:Protein of unknown function (DUF3987)